MSDGYALGFLMVPIVSKCIQVSEKNQAACLTEEDETTSKSSMEVEVQGDTDEREADYSVEVEQIQARVEPAQAFRNLEIE